MSLPFVLPKHVESALRPYFNYTLDQQQSETNPHLSFCDNFESGPHERSSNDSITTSPPKSCNLSPIQFSPLIAKRRQADCGGDPLPECSLSPIPSDCSSSRFVDEEDRRHALRVTSPEQMSIENCSNVVPDMLNFAPPVNNSIGFGKYFVSFFFVRLLSCQEFEHFPRCFNQSGCKNLVIGVVHKCVF